MKQKRYSSIVLIMVFLAFIARGIPDSVLGSAWPAIRNEMNLADPRLGILSFVTGAFIVISSLLSPKLFKNIGDSKSVLISTVLTGTALFGFSLAKSFVVMCLFVAVLGFAAGTIETVLNNYVSIHYETKYINYLHCFYGVGVICSPYFMSLALKNSSWRSGYVYTAVIQIVIAVIIAISIPAWKHVKEIEQQTNEPQKEISLLSMAKMRSLRIMWIIMIAVNFVEYTCSAWGCTYLVEAKVLKEDTAAAMITFFFIGVVTGRLLSGLLANKIFTWNRIYIHTLITILGVVFLVLPLPWYFSAVSLFVIGLGNGPVYPNLLSLTPYNFDRSISGSVMGSQIAAAFVGVMFAPMLYGYIKQLLGINTFVIFLSVSLAVMILLTAYFVVLLKREGRYNTKV